jgi:non-specific serine/threonine protein kinase
VRAIGPFAQQARRPWAPGAALVGDAADFFDPFTGEGIYAGLRGGELLAPFAAEAARRLDDGQLLGNALLNLAFGTPLHADVARGKALFAESAAAFRQAGDAWGEAMTRMGLGEFAVLEGDLAAAASLSGGFVDWARAHGDVRSLAQGLVSLATLALAEGDHDRARRLFGESLAHARAATSTELVAYGLHGLAAVAAGRGDWPRAARLLAVGSRLWEALGAVVWPNRQGAHDALVEQVKTALGRDAFATAWVEGRRLSIDQAVAQGIAPATRQSRAAGADDVRPRDAEVARLTPRDAEAARLTPREREVAALIAQGLSSPRIAEELVISERTADAHADNIRTKLGLHSRAEIAAWATEHGLRGQRARPA